MNQKPSQSEYKAVIEQTLIEMSCLNEQMRQDQGEIERLKAETQIIKAETDLIKTRIQARLEALMKAV